ncbi:MAG: hypothetical protein WAN43_16285 [Rhodomicrobium sp.]
MRNRIAIAAIVSGLGVAALAREFGHRNDSTVSSWKLRGSIPVRYWPRIVAFAMKHGRADINCDALLAAHGVSAPDAPDDESPPAATDLSAADADDGAAPPTQPKLSTGARRASSRAASCS